MKKIKTGNLLLGIFAGIIIIFSLLYIPTFTKSQMAERQKNINQAQQYKEKQAIEQQNAEISDSVK